jgi:signal transduction histidine kinase
MNGDWPGCWRWETRGGLYTQEEIEFARAAAERLIDMQASAEIGQRLMALQRRQLAESQVLDRQARRALHDDILPRLHTAMLLLDQPPNQSPGNAAQALELLSEVHHAIADLLHDMPAASAPEVARRGLRGALEQVIEGELRGAFEQVDWQVAPANESSLEHLPPLAGEVMFYAAREVMRNAARHASDGNVGNGLHLSIKIDCQEGLEIVIEDNGRGTAGQSSKAGGSGQGLALHSTMLAVLGGSLVLDSSPGAATRVRLYLPPESIQYPS